MQSTISLNQKRVESVDLLRGLIMVIMALDHTRDYFHWAFNAGPLNAATTTSALYFTRWITHFCAPTFVFLSGLSAWLQGQRKTKKELSKFLITRGLWLIIFDFTVMTFLLTADIHYTFFILSTLWALGMSMIVLGLVIWLPFRAILLIGLLIVLGHNLIDFAERNRNDFPLWWNLLHRLGVKPLWDGHLLLTLYPFLSWAGLMLLGYCCGRLFTDFGQAERKKILLWLGISALLLFFVLRFINVYGDPSRWSRQVDTIRTIFTFMNVQKYPPSLLFLCATIGPGLIFLSLVKNTRTKLAQVFSVYGRVPFFYFVVHFFILHIASVLVYLSRGHSLAEGIAGAPGLLMKFAIPGEGFSLKVVYLVWITTVIIMYPLCKWYDRYKRNHKEKWWLSYL